jgi:hypothetical protein
MFIFGNRRRTAIRVLVYDGQGFWLCSRPCKTSATRMIASFSG